MHTASELQHPRACGNVIEFHKWPGEQGAGSNRKEVEMDRRTFLMTGVAAAGYHASRTCSTDSSRRASACSPAHADGRILPVSTTTEVIGDGKWIWTEPPEDKTGYLEPRQFEFWTRIAIRAKGPTSQIMASTAVPVELPEQKIDDATVDARGCVARLRRIAPAAGQLVLAARALAPGQVAIATARLQLTLRKQFFHYRKEQFPEKQEVSKDFCKRYLYKNPGILTRSKVVRKLAEQVGGQLAHPWDKAHAFKQWVWKNIHSEKAMRYTGVVSAIRSGIGDCEERACVFASLCRVYGIPTRTVWVPNHVWSEFYLNDHHGQGVWIPAHTSGYTWFGLTGAHELILQKGDGVRIPEHGREMRFAHDWSKSAGPRATIVYTSELRPLSSVPTGDPGPGGRIKPPEGPWITGDHEFDKWLLNGELIKESPFKKNKADVAPWE